MQTLEQWGEMVGPNSILGLAEVGKCCCREIADRLLSEGSIEEVGFDCAFKR